MGQEAACQISVSSDWVRFQRLLPSPSVFWRILPYVDEYQRALDHIISGGQDIILIYPCKGVISLAAIGLQFSSTIGSQGPPFRLHFIKSSRLQNPEEIPLDLSSKNPKNLLPMGPYSAKYQCIFFSLKMCKYILSSPIQK
jgi:hypothetical protein